MKRFRYALDPLCLTAGAAYALGRWLVRPHTAPGSVWHDQFTDLWLIPAALPWLLWLQRRLGLREHDRRPEWREVLLHAAVWSIAAEGLAPWLTPAATGDWRDVIAYAIGALAAGLWWSAA